MRLSICVFIVLLAVALSGCEAESSQEMAPGAVGERPATCRDDSGRSKPVGTKWCRSDKVYHVCRPNGEWSRTGEKC